MVKSQDPFKYDNVSSVHHFLQTEKTTKNLIVTKLSGSKDKNELLRWLWSHRAGLSTMRQKIINRHLHFFAFLQTFQCLFQQFKVKGIRVIEIVLVFARCFVLLLVKNLQQDSASENCNLNFSSNCLVVVKKDEQTL